MLLYCLPLVFGFIRIHVGASSGCALDVILLFTLCEGDAPQCLIVIQSPNQFSNPSTKDMTLSWLFESYLKWKCKYCKLKMKWKMAACCVVVECVVCAPFFGEPPLWDSHPLGNQMPCLLNRCSCNWDTPDGPRCLACLSVSPWQWLRDVLMSTLTSHWDLNT